MFDPIPQQTEKVATAVLNAAFQVHTSLGPGLLESVYEQCLCHELSKSKLSFQSQVTVPIQYDGVTIEGGLRIDLFVEGLVVVDLKSVALVLPIHEAQLLTYLKLTKSRLGLLLNSNTSRLKDGIKRLAL